jgi:hypothetical protein
MNTPERPPVFSTKLVFGLTVIALGLSTKFYLLLEYLQDQLNIQFYYPDN